MPPLDFLSRQEDNKNRYEKGKSVKNIDAPKIEIPESPLKQKIEINEDFAKLHSMGSIM